MPYSSNENKSVVVDWYLRLKPTRVLDIGVGAGTYHDLLANKHKAQWVGIEAWEPYVAEFKLEDKYDKLIIKDVTEMKPTELTADLCIAGDCLEHMSQTRAIALIDTLKQTCKHTIISLPIIHWEQGAEHGNHFEIHQHDWSYDDMKQVIGDNLIESVKGDVLGYFLMRGNL